MKGWHPSIGRRKNKELNKAQDRTHRQKLEVSAAVRHKLRLAETGVAALHDFCISINSQPKFDDRWTPSTLVYAGLVDWRRVLFVLLWFTLENSSIFLQIDCQCRANVSIENCNGTCVLHQTLFPVDVRCTPLATTVIALSFA